MGTRSPSPRPARPARRRLAALATLLAMAVAVLAGCGDDSSPAAAEPAHDAADVTFATEMSQHHQQALQMVALTNGRELDSDFGALVAEIRDDQTPEIQQMNGWLDTWGEPVPGSDTDMSGMSGMGAMDPTTMPGMMSNQQMTSLANAPDATFEVQWLRLMIAHHQGAITMARTELQSGQYPDALTLAGGIASAQADQITRMRAMLAS